MAVVLDENAIGEAVATLVEQIRATAQRSRVAIVGIRSRGDEVAERVCAALEEAKIEHDYGKYRMQQEISWNADLHPS